MSLASNLDDAIIRNGVVKDMATRHVFGLGLGGQVFGLRGKALSLNPFSLVFLC